MSKQGYFRGYGVFLAIIVHVIFVGLLLFFKVPVDGVWGIILSALHVLLAVSLMFLRWRWQQDEDKRIALFGYDTWIAIVCFMSLTFNFVPVLCFWSCIIWILLSAKSNLFYRKRLESVEALEREY